MPPSRKGSCPPPPQSKGRDRRECGCQFWLGKPLNMGALCGGGVGRGTEKEKLLLPLDGWEQRAWPWRSDDQPIFPTFPPSLISCSFHHRLPGLKALFLFCCQAQWLWLHSKAGHSDMTQKTCTGHVSTICPPPHTLPLTPWWLETSSGLETGDNYDQDSSSSLYSSYNYCRPKNNLCSKPLNNMSIFIEVKRQLWKWYTAAKSLQSCLTLCDPTDVSAPGSPVPGILQARILEWVTISFSNAWKWKLKVKSLSCVRLPATSWTAAYQAPLSIGFSRQEYWSGLSLPSLENDLNNLYLLIHPSLVAQW